eukprot:scaffold542_cov202-Alexandrium_tamarense.AAC.39
MNSFEISPETAGQEPPFVSAQPNEQPLRPSDAEPPHSANVSNNAPATPTTTTRPTLRLQINADGTLRHSRNRREGHRHHHHTINIPISNRQQVHFHRMNPPTILPPLEAQPVPNQSNGYDDDAENATTTTNDTTSQHKEASINNMKKLECAICFEYMDIPVGCGNCQTRFCRPCLERVLRQELSNRSPQSTDPPNSARCPHCRSFFTRQDIKIDNELAQEIAECLETVTCPFKGCNTELQIGLLKEHERSCQYIRMRCKYAEWGCAWVGKKMDLQHHEQHICEFKAGLGKLVEKFRQSEERSNHILQHHQMQLAASSRMMAMQSRQLMMIRARNAGNVFDSLELAYQACCFPGRLYASRELWGSMLTGEGQRSLVCNVLLLAPMLVSVFHVAFQGVQLLPQLLHTLTEKEQHEGGTSFYDILDFVLVSIITGLLGILCTACFFIDNKSPSEWTLFSVGGIITGQPLLRDVAACCVATAVFSTMEFYGFLRGTLMWSFTVVVSIFFSSFVATTMEKLSGAKNVLKNARAWPVVVFGLRYGCLAYSSDFLSCVTAVVLWRILGSFSNLPSLFVVDDSECFISHWNGSFLGIGAVALAAINAALMANEPTSFGPLIGFARAHFAYGCICLQINVWHGIGCKLAVANYERKNSIMRDESSSSSLPTQRPTPIGSSVVGLCSFLMLVVAFA